jgi:hypothetical protein
MALTRVFSGLDLNRNGLLERSDLMPRINDSNQRDTEAITTRDVCGSELVGVDNVEDYFAARGLSRRHLQQIEDELLDIERAPPPDRSPFLRLGAFALIPLISVAFILTILFTIAMLGLTLPLFLRSPDGLFFLLAREMKECVRLAFGPADADTRADRVIEALRTEARRVGINGLPCSFEVAPAAIPIAPPPTQTCGVSLRPVPKGARS